MKPNEFWLTCFIDIDLNSLQKQLGMFVCSRFMSPSTEMAAITRRSRVGAGREPEGESCWP